MSRDHGPVGLAIEWSPRGVVAFDSATGKTQTAEDLPSLNLGKRDAILALSRRGVFVRTTRVPDTNPDEVRLILMMRSNDLFPLPPLDLAWDFKLTDDVNSEGRLAVVAAVPCADLRRALDAASAAGIQVKSAVPLAFGAVLLAQEVGLAEAAVVESVEDGPAVDIISGGALRASRAAPPSASLEMEVNRALVLAGLDEAPIVAAGGAPIEHAAHKTDRSALMALADSPSDRIKLRLELPEAVAARQTAAARQKIRLAGLVFALSAVSALTAASQYYDFRQAQKAADAKSVASLNKLKDATKKAVAERGRQEALQKKLDLAFAPAQKPSEIFAVVTRAVPAEGAWLKGITFERGRPVSLRGTARTENVTAELLRRLDRTSEGRFRNVSLSNANSTEENKVPVTEFVISAFPVGNVPLLSKGRTGR